MRARAVAGLVGALCIGMAARAVAQSPVTVTVTGPVGDTLREINPRFVVRVEGAADPGRSVTLQLSETPDFRSTLVEQAAPGDNIDVRLTTPLPSGRPLYWRAIARNGTDNFASVVTGPRITASWVTLVTPNSANGSVLTSRFPRFVWKPAGVSSPLSAFRYDLEIETTAPFSVVSITRGIRDTVASSPVQLEFSTSYRWSIVAYASSGDSTRIRSSGSFVIVDETIPPVTLLYQNFPNPFPTPATPRTCIWFDLAVNSNVRLDVLDIRGNHVRTIIPGSGLGVSLPPGRYGRSSIGGSEGCDTRIAWDGTADDGRVAHAGVYLLRLRADGTETIRRVVFRGR